MRTLIFGPMPRGARPDEHIAAGAWCFAGQESLFPGWDGPGDSPDAFLLPPDPYPNAASIEAAAKAANGEALRLTAVLGERLNNEWKTSFSPRYWQMALGPFLVLACHMLAERQKRVLDLIALHGNRPVRAVLLPPEWAYSFDSSLDFMLRGVQDVHFNHYVFSRIAEHVAPPEWQLAYQPAHNPPPLENTSLPVSGRLKERLRHGLLRLPFPPAKGFRLWQLAVLSLAVLLNERTVPDHRHDFSIYCDHPQRWHFPAERLILACLPSCLRETPKRFSRAKTEKPGPLRGMSPVYMQNDRYRLHLASLLENGCRLFSIQHGANYGNLRSIGGLPFEYSQHAFFTWGWNKHPGMPCNALPMPHPAPAALTGKHKEREPALILVGTEMSTLAYRLKSRPQSKALIAYRAAKLAFLRGVLEHPGQQADIFYRPYFTTVGGLDDEAFILRHLPGMRLSRGDLTRHMLRCRLLALDHYGTTLHLAMAANVPTVAFWKSADWGLNEDSEWAADILREAGILHDSPHQAAQKVAEVWADVPGWWGDNLIQSARKLWLERYVWTGKVPGQRENALMLTWRWLRALRSC